MKTNSLTLVAGLLFATATLTLAATNDLSTALQKGLFEEEANHNLDAAVTAYQSVATQFDKDRKLAATAIFRLGEVYRKQGKTNEAAGQYERILREFSDQTTLANLSRSLLNKGGVVVQKVAIEEGAANQTAEEQEIQRIKAMIKDSPDLINAPVGDLTPLGNAAALGQLRVAEFLLENRADLNKKVNYRTALHRAVESGHKSMVELLIAHGADLEAGNSEGGTALQIASQRGFKSIAETLLAHKADVNAKDSEGNTPLSWAAINGYKAVAELLLANEADVNAKNRGEETPLFWVIASKNLEMAEFLIDRKADVNVIAKNGYAALHHAVESRQSQMVQLLLRNGANPEIKIPKYSISLGNRLSDVFEFTPLNMAAQAGQKEIVEMLLAGKANPNSTNRDGATPLHYAASGGFVEIAKVLLANGATIDALDSQHSTPLRWSLGSQKIMAEFLLSNKANPNIQNKDGETPLSYEKKYNSPNREAFIELLLKYGANENAERPTRISAGRDLKSSQPIYLKGSAAYNRYSLFEIIAQALFPFPDLAHIKIHRLDPKTQQTNVIDANVEAALKSGDCSKNVWLEWGDIIEIPELDHPINQIWSGYPKEQLENLQKCLERKFSIRVKGETTNVTLRWPGFWLRDVIKPLLRASSDKTRIKVRRVDPVTKKPEEIIHNLENNNDAANLIWLLDGDAIEIPEKP